MPLDQPNFGYYSYESDDGTTYNIRADAHWAGVGAHGLAARANGQPRYIATGARHPRTAKYVDLTTGRSKVGPIGTAADFAALALGATQTFTVHGSAVGVVYTLVATSPEKQAGSVIYSAVGDHA